MHVGGLYPGQGRELSQLRHRLGVRPAAGAEGRPRESCGGRTGGSVWGCPGPGSGPSQSSAQAPRRRRGEKGHAYLLLLQFIGHLDPSGPGPALAAPLRLRLCSAALGPLGFSSPPPARCARVERCLCLQLARTLTNLPDNQAPPSPIGHWNQAASFFSHWKGRVQTARVRLPELAEVGGPALKGVELSVRGAGQGMPGLCTQCCTSASGVPQPRPFFAARSILKWFSLFPHCDSAQSELKERSPKMKGAFLRQGNVTLIAYAKSVERATRSPRGHPFQDKA